MIIRVIHNGELYAYERLNNGDWEWATPNHLELWYKGLSTMDSAFKPLKNVIRERFTGITDVNNKWIFENDTVKYSHSKDSTEYTGTVVYRDDRCSFWLKTGDDSGFAMLAHQKIIELI